MRKGAWIGTYTGIHFYPLDPKPEDVRLEDISRALSQICRFNGHTKEPYSVALHCLNVSKFLKEWGCDELTQLYGLLHDAAEAYIGDITRPFKMCLADIGCLKAFDDIEVDVTEAIYRHFNIHCPDEKQAGVVKEADNYVLALEAKRYMYNTGDWRLERTNLADRLDTLDGMCHGEARLLEFYYKYAVLNLLNSVWDKTPIGKEKPANG